MLAYDILPPQILYKKTFGEAYSFAQEQHFDIFIYFHHFHVNVWNKYTHK